MIDNTVGDHLLLSDYRLERWLLRYSQKSGDGSGGGGGGNGSLVTKVQMKNLVRKKLHHDHIHTPITCRHRADSGLEPSKMCAAIGHISRLNAMIQQKKKKNRHGRERRFWTHQTPQTHSGRALAPRTQWKHPG